MGLKLLDCMEIFFEDYLCNRDPDKRTALKDVTLNRGNIVTKGSQSVKNFREVLKERMIFAAQRGSLEVWDFFILNLCNA